tara:strand:- start:649 stop:1074 length:426 start_codon:yes stop_codon:yes gene_type:complete
MIKYLLKCICKKEFESWFSSSIEYEKLKKKKLIECIFCKSIVVEKSIMSPYVAGKKINKFDRTFESKEFIKIKKDLNKLKKFVEKNFEFVGEKFSREVKEIYYGNKKNKNIYGTVSLKEREELEEEGIELSSIPWTKDKEN